MIRTDRGEVSTGRFAASFGIRVPSDKTIRRLTRSDIVKASSTHPYSMLLSYKTLLIIISILVRVGDQVIVHEASAPMVLT